MSQQGIFVSIPKYLRKWRSDYASVLSNTMPLFGWGERIWESKREIGEKLVKNKFFSWSEIEYTDQKWMEIIKVCVFGLKEKEKRGTGLKDKFSLGCFEFLH